MSYRLIDRIRLELALRGHAKECKQKFRSNFRGRKIWLELWPASCPTCEGAGGTHYPDSFNPLTGEGHPPEHAACPDCLGAGICPRCGGELSERWFDGLDLELTPCPECNWQHGINGGDIMPPMLELAVDCFCPLEDELPLLAPAVRHANRRTR